MNGSSFLWFLISHKLKKPQELEPFNFQLKMGHRPDSSHTRYTLPIVKETRWGPAPAPAH
jgi:hypothetical protein